MKLPDFSEDRGFLALRQQMNARRPGHFVLFDATRHLTGQERARLENQGLATTLDQLRILPDQTLAMKNGRVLVYTAQPAAKGKRDLFHVAACATLHARPAEPLIATTCQSSPFPVPDQAQRRSLSVCPQCLTELGYKGFSLTRNRRIRYSEQLLKHFQLSAFFRTYTLYPVRIEGSRSSAD